MKFERDFKISSYCLIGSGFAAISAAGGLHWLFVCLFAAAFTLSCFLDTKRIREQIPVWILNCLSVGYILFFCFDMLALSTPLLPALSHLVLLAALTKLLTISTDRDYFFLYLSSFAVLLASAVMTVSPVFAVCLFIFVLSGIHSFILFEMRCSRSGINNSLHKHSLARIDPTRDVGTKPPPAGANRSLTLISAGMALIILMLALPLYLILPRSAVTIWKRPSGDPRLISGFSETVELGRSGKVEQSPAVVMRVRTSIPADQIPENLKWRGMAFDFYDGRSWKRSDPIQFPVPVREGYFKLEDSAIGTEWLYQTYYLEALSTNAVFTAHKTLAVSRDAGMLLRDYAGNLFAYRKTEDKLRYVVLSDLSRPNPEYMSDSQPIPPDIVKTYLQLPGIDAGIRRLAEKTVAPAETVYEKTVALERFIRTRYTYSLDLPEAGEAEDPVSMFLFKTRRGHCEYFASAMAIMLRYIGIPSRLVNGFRAGEYNGIGNDWIVRQYHAHSWVEAYIPPYGWLEFDPTPAQPHRAATSLSRFWSNLMDAGSLWWWEGVVSYDAPSRNSLVGSLRSVTERFLEYATDLGLRIYGKGRDILAKTAPPELSYTLKGNRFWQATVLALFLLSLGFFLKRASTRFRPFFYRNKPQLFAENFYNEALHLLSKHRIVREKGQTPLEFARSISHHQVADALTSLTHLYNRIRYGPPDTAPSAKEAEVYLRILRRSLKTEPALRNKA